MEERQGITSEKAKQSFLELNNKMEKLIETTPKYKVDEVYGDAFGKIFDDAVQGDLVAQDYLGWIFKRGKKNLVPENLELSMKWQILAGANGNQYTLERINLFLNSAYEQIMSLPDFEQISYAFSLHQKNYQSILGRLVCEAICDEMDINENNIITDIPTTLEYSPSIMYKFDQAKNKAINSVIDYLRKTYKSLPEFQSLEPETENTVEDVQKEPEKPKSLLSKLFNKQKK